MDNLEKCLEVVYEKYCGNREIHEAAFIHNSQYRIFWNSHSDEMKANFVKMQHMQSISTVGYRAQEMLFHAATFGVSYGIKKIINAGKPTREEIIREIVTDSNFSQVITSLNFMLYNIPIQQSTQTNIASGIYCSECGSLMYAGAPFCSSCGAKSTSYLYTVTTISSAPQFCSNCGLKFSNQAMFCIRCSQKR
jgi:hypothetical protein